MSALDPSAPGLPLVGLGGSSLPTATGADEVPVSTGAGTTYAAQTLGAAVVTGLVANLSADDAGTAIIADGAGDVQKTSADVSAILAAASASAARSALGLGTPTTLAAQARAEAQRRRGPLAMVFPSSSDYVRSLSTDSPSTPAVGLSTSGVLVVRSIQAGGYANSFLLFSGVNATRGFFFAIPAGSGGARLLVRSMSASGNVDAFVPNFVATSGWHAVAWSIPADGLTLRYSLDGAAVATVTPGTTPWPWTARLAADPVYIGTDAATAGCPLPLAYAAVWSSVLSDADLVTLSTSPSAGAPTLPSAPAWEWAAAAHAGAQSVTIGNARYDTTGSPRVWMP